MIATTRFAPSPTGPLHLGHAFSARTAFDLAQKLGGRFLLRIEDIDTARCQPGFEDQIYQDLRWLGLRWPQPVMRQSMRMGSYHSALDRLDALGVTYRCLCTRGDIRAALSAPQEGAAIIGPDGPVYPGTCREAGHHDPTAAIRLDMRRALTLTGSIRFDELGPRHAGTRRFSSDWLIDHVGDVVLARRDIGTSYHLAVVVDDAAQGITHVVRGEDLFEATPVHRVLQILLDLPCPTYLHHRLIRDANGKRLAKRDDARAISTYREAGFGPENLYDIMALPGIDEPSSL